MTPLDALKQHRLLPVVVIETADTAAALAETLATNGLPVLEFTLRTPAALDAIEAAAGVDGVVVGAGTVVTVRQAEQAVAAGARFLVSPGVSVPVIQWAVAHDIPIFPGVATATEIMAATHAGANIVKFFPAEPLGGLPMLKALSAPFPALSFVPTGSIGPAQARSYLEHPKVVAVGGSWMVPADALKAKDFTRIGELTREAVALVHG
jgi:2-dehydro-3-deoxyphosphogluconate aldolase/(4S)-4-hydroxy-2-oxoglutarate aldolase